MDTSLVISAIGFLALIPALVVRTARLIPARARTDFPAPATPLAAPENDVPADPRITQQCDCTESTVSVPRQAEPFVLSI